MSVADPAAALKARLASLPARLTVEAAAALRQAGDDTVEAARRLLVQGGPGPSSPGEPPHDPRGDLARSLAVTQADGEPGATIGAANPVASYLEYGTRKMAARPFLRPAVESVRPDALVACREALARAARSADEGP